MLKIAEISESCFRVYRTNDGKDEHFIATFISRELAEEYIDMKEELPYFLNLEKQNIENELST